MKILMVDDSRAVHAAVTELIGKKADLDHVFDGQQALDKLKVSPNVYDLILLDWEMPTLTGPETFAGIKANGFKVPVIMLTSKNAPEDIAQMLEAGVAGYIMKPFTKDILIGKISEIFEKEF